MITNLFSVDLEDWFTPLHLTRDLSDDILRSNEIRIEKSTLKLLELLDIKQVKATFFVLGWIAKELPDLIKEISSRGHEIASHSYSHKILTLMSKEEFKKEIQLSLEAIDKAIGKPVKGFRAPCFSVTNKNLWVFDVLKENGFIYDSSIFPFGDYPNEARNQKDNNFFKLKNGLIEFPIKAIYLGGVTIPLGGGGYFRLYPYSFFKKKALELNSKSEILNFYIHPWEIDEDQPKLNINPLAKFKHYINLDKTYSRLEKLLSDFHFTSFEDYCSIFIR
ncbi:MAG: polysaccharide deacetylase family protein [Candidatus Kapabacteria bacterium]|nr:polysaccharide deacetylase family protein [Candidatus Kapabacteria bacterium]